jgi:hypothetical protein
MAKKTVYGLTKRDRDLVDKTISQMRAGKPALSKRPTPTRRRNRGGGGGSHYQIIRGTCAAAVLDTDQAFQLENLVALEQLASLPSDPVWIANIPAVSHSEGDTVYALYRSGISVTHTGAPATVDWEALGGSTSSSPPLRAFELTATKNLASATATAKWLDLDGNMVGSNTTIYDPGFRFSGRTATFYDDEETGFRGYALLRTDLAAEDPDRWEIITMESFAEWATVEYYGGGIWILSTAGFGGGEWDYRRPAADGGQITVFDPAAILPATLTTGMKAMARLAVPDTTPPTYAIQGVKGGAGGGGGLVSVLIESDIDAASWNNAGSILTPSVTEVTEFVLGDDETSYELGEQINIENHDPGETLEVGSGEKYIGLCSRNAWEHLVIHMWTCRKLVVPD